VAEALINLYRKIRAALRYHFGYTPEILDNMTTEQLAQAWGDLQYILKKLNNKD
jgi:hypothetical protein